MHTLATSSLIDKERLVTKPSIPLSHVHCNARELELVKLVLDSGTLFDGEITHNFEEKFSNVFLWKYAISFPSANYAVEVAKGMELLDGWVDDSKVSCALYDLRDGCPISTGVGAIICTNDSSTRDVLLANRETSISEICAAIGIAQLERFPRNSALLKEVAFDYFKLCKGHHNLSMPVDSSDIRNHLWINFVIWVNTDLDTQNLVDMMLDHGIETKAVMNQSNGVFNGIAIPFFPQISPNQQKIVVDTLLMLIQKP